MSKRKRHKKPPSTELVNHAREIAAHYADSIPSEQLAELLGVPASVLPGAQPNVATQSYREDLDFTGKLGAARDALSPQVAGMMHRATERAMTAELRERELQLTADFSFDAFMNQPLPSTSTSLKNQLEITYRSIQASVEQLRASGVRVTFEQYDPWRAPRARVHHECMRGSVQWQCMNPRTSHVQAIVLAGNASPYPRQPSYDVTYGRDYNPIRPNQE